VGIGAILVDVVAPQVPLEVAEFKDDIGLVIDEDIVIVELTALEDGPIELLVAGEDKAIVVLVLPLAIIEDEMTMELMLTDNGKVVILGPTMDELGRPVELIPPTGTVGNVLKPGKEDDDIVVDDVANGASVTDGWPA
jgi:hypothetical protein